MPKAPLVIPRAEPQPEFVPKKLEAPIPAPPSPPAKEDRGAHGAATRTVPSLPEIARAQNTKEISGTASLPAEDIPLPNSADLPPLPPVLSSETYAQAKDNLRANLAQGEKTVAVKGQSDNELEEYCKQNITWLYEIYKLGGMSREDFLQKIRDCIQGEKDEAATPENPALANLGKEIDKKK